VGLLARRKEEEEFSAQPFFSGVDPEPHVRIGSSGGNRRQVEHRAGRADQTERRASLVQGFDLKSEACTLHDRLRVTARDGRPEAYDPAIKNGGTT
jgi:hypothetical protein